MYPPLLTKFFALTSSFFSIYRKVWICCQCSTSLQLFSRSEKKKLCIHFCSHKASLFFFCLCSLKQLSACNVNFAKFFFFQNFAWRSTAPTRDCKWAVNLWAYTPWLFFSAKLSDDCSSVPNSACKQGCNFLINCSWTWTVRVEKTQCASQHANVNQCALENARD